MANCIAGNNICGYIRFGGFKLVPDGHCNVRRFDGTMEYCHNTYVVIKFLVYLNNLFVKYIMCISRFWTQYTGSQIMAFKLGKGSP